MNDEPIKADESGQVYNLGELFARDPREINDEDFKALVAGLREARTKFVLGGGSTPSTKLTETQQAAKRLDLDISL